MTGLVLIRANAVCFSISATDGIFGPKYSLAIASRAGRKDHFRILLEKEEFFFINLKEINNEIF